jgi:hypothetical protein
MKNPLFRCHTVEKIHHCGTQRWKKSTFARKKVEKIHLAVRKGMKNPPSNAKKWKKSTVERFEVTGIFN